MQSTGAIRSSAVYAAVWLSLSAMGASCKRNAEQRATVQRAPETERIADTGTAIDASEERDEPDGAVANEVADGGASETRIPRGWIAESEREPNVEQRFANEADREQCTPLPSPRLPVVAPDLRDAVERLRPQARQLLRCFNGAYRVSHRPDPRCDAWTSALIAAGPAAAHATGIELTTLKAMRGGALCGSPFEGAAANRAAYVIARTGGVEAMPYLLRFAAINVPIRGRYEMDRTLSLVFESVYRVALRSLGPPREGVYASETESYQSERVRRWGHWFVLHRAEPRAQWQESMLAIQRRRSTASDVRTRLVAAQILEQFESERALVGASIERACRELRALANGGSGLAENYDSVLGGRLCDLRRDPFGDHP